MSRLEEQHDVEDHGGSRKGYCFSSCWKETFRVNWRSDQLLVFQNTYHSYNLKDSVCDWLSTMELFFYVCLFQDLSPFNTDRLQSKVSRFRLEQGTPSTEVKHFFIFVIWDCLFLFPRGRRPTRHYIHWRCSPRTTKDSPYPQVLLSLWVLSGAQKHKERDLRAYAGFRPIVLTEQKDTFTAVIFLLNMGH